MRRGSPAKILVDRGVKVESVLCTVPAKRAMEPELAPPTIPTLDMNGYHFIYHHSREALSIDQSQAAYLARIWAAAPLVQRARVLSRRMTVRE